MADAKIGGDLSGDGRWHVTEVAWVTSAFGPRFTFAASHVAIDHVAVLLEQTGIDRGVGIAPTKKPGQHRANRAARIGQVVRYRGSSREPPLIALDGLHGLADDPPKLDGPSIEHLALLGHDDARGQIVDLARDRRQRLAVLVLSTDDRGTTRCRTPVGPSRRTGSQPNVSSHAA